MDVGVTFYFYTLTSPASATAQDHNELKRGKKSILTGRCTVCLKKAKINVFYKKKNSNGMWRVCGVKKKFQKTLILVIEFDIY